MTLGESALRIGKPTWTGYGPVQLVLEALLLLLIGILSLF